MSFIGSTKVTDTQATVLYESPLDKESNVHTIAVLNEGITPNETVKVTLAYYDASEPSTRNFAMFEVGPESSKEYGKTINLRPGDKLIASTDGGEVSILVGAFLDEDSLVTSIFTIRGEYDVSLQYAPYDVVYYQGGSFVSTATQTGNLPTNAGWTPLGSGFNSYGDWDVNRVNGYPALSVVEHAGSIWVTASGAAQGAEPGIAAAWINFTDLDSSQLTDSSTVGGGTVKGSLNILDSRLDNIDTDDVPEDALTLNLDPDPGNDSGSGLENAYFSRSRVRSSVGAAGDLQYDPATGVFTAFTLTQADVEGFIDGRVDKPFVDALNVDADTLDGIDITQLARTDIAPTFAQDINVTGNIIGNLDGQVLGKDSSVILDTTGDISVFTGNVLGEVEGTLRGSLISEDSGIIVNANTSEFFGKLIGNVESTTGLTTLNNVRVTGDLNIETEIQGALRGSVTSPGLSTFGNIDIQSGTINNVNIDASLITATTITATSIEAQTGGFQGDIISTGTSQFNNMQISGDLNFTQLLVTGFADMRSNAKVGIDLEVVGNLIVGGAVQVQGNTEFGNINVTGGNITGANIGSGSFPVDIIAEDITILNSFTAENVDATFTDVEVTGTLTGNVEGRVQGNVVSQDGTSVIVDAFSGIVRADLIGATAGTHTGATIGTHTGNVIGPVVGTIGAGDVSNRNTGGFSILQATNTTTQDLTVTGLATFQGELSFTNLDIADLTINNNMTVKGISYLSSVDIGSGTIDGTVIGGVESDARNVTGTLVKALSGFLGDLTGDVTGDVVGDVVGSLTGNLYGDIWTSNGASRILDGGDGTALYPAMYIGDMQGNLTGSFTGVGNGTFTGDIYADDSTTKLVDATTQIFNGDLTGDVTGNITGDVVGDVVGDIRGNILDTTGVEVLNVATKVLTGNVLGDVTGNVSGNIISTGTSDFATITVSEEVLGDVRGNIIASNSSIIVDHVNNTVNSSIITASDKFVGLLDGNVEALAGTSKFFNIDVLGSIDLSAASGNITADVTGSLTGPVTGNVTGDVVGDVTGDLIGDVYASNGADRVLDSGNGTTIPALFRGEVLGNVTGNIYSDNSTLIVDANNAQVNADLDGNVTTTDGISTFYDVNITNSLIAKNLTITGTTTSVNADNLEITDNEILLNKGESGAGVTAGSAGIRIDRGTSPSRSLVWREDFGGHWRFENARVEAPYIDATLGFTGNITGSVFNNDNTQILFNHFCIFRANFQIN